MNKKLLVFDFDGTIADTLSIALIIINEIGEDYGWPTLDKEQFFEYKKKSTKELMDIVGLKYRQLPRIVRRSRRGFKKHMNKVNPITGMPEVLEELKKRGYRMGILTSNTRKNVEKFLAIHGLDHFEFIYAPNSLFGKAPVLKKILRRYHMKAEDVIMIGDEHRDLDAANQAGVDGLGVLWGFHTEEQLGEGTPVNMLEKPKQFLDLFPSKAI
ncbi:MAG: HAD-IA family hydrolase [Bacteroidota bacterium]